VALALQPLGEAAPGTAVNEKLHRPATTCTASIDSFAMTACA
jgi:hypothetical protein